MCSFHVKVGFTIILAVCGIFSFASAQDSSTASTISTSSTPTSTTSAYLPKCDELRVMENINILGISGTWYELARKGYGTYIQNLQCLQMDVSYMNGTAWIYQTYATDLTTMNNQSTYQYIVQYNKTNVSEYSIAFTDYALLPVPIFKILETDYENYLVICSYLPVWQDSAAAFVYFRNRNTPDDAVYDVINNASSKYLDFNGLNLVYQGPNCNSSVSRVLPMTMMIFVLFAVYALKFIH